MNGCSKEGSSLSRRISRRAGLPTNARRSPHPQVVRRSDTAEGPDLELVRAREVLDVKREEGGPARLRGPSAQVEPRAAAHVETRRRLDRVEIFAAEPEENDGKTDFSRELVRAGHL